MKGAIALWVSAITLIGAAVRIAGLNRGLWWDEIYMLVVSIRRPLSQIVTIFPGDNQHPLYSVLARLSFVAFGEHVWTLRLPALLFGVAAIPALYLLTSTVAPRTEALAASAFLAVSYHHVWFSQNARGYSGLALFAIFTTYFLLRGYQTNRRGFYIAYSVAAALGVYTHLTMVFPVAAQVAVMGALAFADWRTGAEMKRWKFPLHALGLAIMLVLLFYAPILAQMRHFFQRKSVLQSASTPSWAMGELLRGLALGFGTWAALTGAAIFALYGAWSYWRQSKVVFSLLVLPAFFMGAGTLLAGRTMYPRFYFPLIGFGVMILMRGLFAVPAFLNERARGKRTANALCAITNSLTAVLVAGLLAASSATLVRNYRYPKQDFEGAMHFLEAQTKPGEKVLTAGGAIYPYHDYFLKPWQSVLTLEELQNVCLQGKPVWMVYSFPRYIRAAAPGLMKMIQERFTTVRVFPGTIGDGDVVVARYPKG
ncbi:MAG TPA: glycosyltransferase family 39 protein [Bryobacteraceae bacterium]